MSGSWKITAICAPRIWRSCLSLSPIRSVPSKIARPGTSAPGVRSSRVWVSTVLPLPDSPMIPRVCPASTLKETPRTAWTSPSAVGKLTRSR